MKLHIGGEQVKEGWKILNIQKKDGVDFIGDISDLSQFDDDSIEEIYASHVFEHVIQKKIKNTLIGIHRVIKENGKFYVSVPDMNILCKMFLEPKIPPKVKTQVLRMMFGGQVDDFDFHYFGWDYTLLESYLLGCGFKKVEKVKSFSLFDDTSDYAPFSNIPISLNVIAYK
tara:strand:- start:128 stop:640 length:513 start_codon:yes stop_codon:yes gene_type:complete